MKSMSKKLIRKRVGKPTGKTSKAGRPIYETKTGERRSEYSSTIQLDNGKWINIPSIHNGKYYSDKELKEAVEDNRMLPTSEHKSEKEAILAAKQRSKNLKQGGLLKAHQGTVVNGQIVYPQTSQAPNDPEPTQPKPQIGLPNPNPFVTDPNAINPNLIKTQTDEGITFKDKMPDGWNYQDAIKNVPKFKDGVEMLEQGKPDTSNVEPAPLAPLPIPKELEAQPQPVQQATKQQATLADLAEFNKELELKRKAMQVATPVPHLAQAQAQLQPSMQQQIEQYYKQQGQAMNDRWAAMNKFRQSNQQKIESYKEFQDLETVGKKFETMMNSVVEPFKLEMKQLDEKYAALPKNFKNWVGRQQEMKAVQKQIHEAQENALQTQQYSQARFNVANAHKALEAKVMAEFDKQYKPVGEGQSVNKQMAFNEGGTVMEKQMEMNFGDKPDMSSGTFIFKEGGMKDDGGEKDPVSGNDIPSGATAKEVRDDVPAMVSEGEFIFPADVTRFIGLDKLMELRQDAKMGLKKMEMMGQLGDPEDAVLDDDIPFDDEDIIIEFGQAELEEKNEGGIIGFSDGTADAGEQGNQYYNIQEEANKAYSKKYTWYKNEAGDMKAILTDWQGNPLEDVPAGYKIMLNEDGSPVTKKPEKAPDDDLEATKPQPTQQKDDDDDKDPEPMFSTEYLAKEFGGAVILDKNGNPRSMTETGYNAVLASANRLGLDTNTYFNLPWGAKMDMLGQEFAGMFGKEVDQDYVNNIVKQVQAGEYKSKGLFGFLGGIGDWISGLFGGNDDAETTQKKINVVNDAKKNNKDVFKNLYDPKPGKKRYERDDTYGEATNLMRTGDLTTSGRINRGTTSAVRKAQSDKTQAGLAGPGFASGKFRQKEDADDRRQARQANQAKESYGMRSGPQTGKKTVAGSANQNKKAQQNKDKENLSKAYGGGGDGNMASGKFGNKGMLIAKPPTKKKPTTQRKALVGKY